MRCGEGARLTLIAGRRQSSDNGGKVQDAGLLRHASTNLPRVGTVGHASRFQQVVSIERLKL